MIAHGGLIAKHMLHDVGHEKTFGKPEPYYHVEHWTEQSRERCKQVGNGSGPESERHKGRRLVPGLYLTRARSHGTVRCSGFHHGMALHGEIREVIIQWQPQHRAAARAELSLS